MNMLIFCILYRVLIKCGVSEPARVCAYLSTFKKLSWQCVCVFVHVFMSWIIRFNHGFRIEQKKITKFPLLQLFFLSFCCCCCGYMHAYFDIVKKNFHRALIMIQFYFIGRTSFSERATKDWKGDTKRRSTQESRVGIAAAEIKITTPGKADRLIHSQIIVLWMQLLSKLSSYTPVNTQSGSQTDARFAFEQ